MYDQVVNAVLLALAMLGQTPPKDIGQSWVGKVARAVKLNDENGKPVDVSKEFGKRPVILVFYRGVW